MLEIVQSFKDNVREVEEYFLFLQKVEEDYLTLNNNTGGTFQISTDLSRMFKANAFLIIYNLIEATIKSGLWEIFEKITSDSVSYDKLIEQLQLLWIDHRIKLEFRSSDEAVNLQISKAINLALEEAVSYYKHKQQMKFDAGSLDIKGIHATFKRHGLASIPAHDLISESFKMTRLNRNNLAHGDMTFKECGKEYSYKDLRIIKCHVVRHLFKILFHIQKFIDEKTYRKVIVVAAA